MHVVKPGAAAAMALAGMATLGLIDNFVPFIAERGSLWQFHALRAVMALIIMGLVAVAGLGVLRPRRPGAVAARSFFTAGAMLIYFGCIAVMPIGVVVAGLFTAPIWVLLIAYLFQGKAVGPARIGAVIAGSLGVYLVMGLEPDLLRWGPYLMLPLLAGLLYAIGAVATRAWCEGESTLTLTAGFFAMLGLFGAAGLLIFPWDGTLTLTGTSGFSMRGWVPLDGGLVFWIAVQAVGSMIGIALIFRAYQTGEASRVAVFEYSLLVFASFWAWVIWGQGVPPLGMLGMALIAGAGGIIVMRSTP